MRIRTITFVFTGLALLLITPPGAAAQEREEDTSSPSLRIDWTEFKKLYDAKAIELIDVRGDVVFESGHIPGRDRSRSRRSRSARRSSAARRSQSSSTVLDRQSTRAPVRR